MSQLKFFSSRYNFRNNPKQNYFIVTIKKLKTLNFHRFYLIKIKPYTTKTLLHQNLKPLNQISQDSKS